MQSHQMPTTKCARQIVGCGGGLAIDRRIFDDLIPRSAGTQRQTHDLDSTWTEKEDELSDAAPMRLQCSSNALNDNAGPNVALPISKAWDHGTHQSESLQVGGDLGPGYGKLSDGSPCRSPNRSTIRSDDLHSAVRLRVLHAPTSVTSPESSQPPTNAF